MCGLLPVTGLINALNVFFFGFYVKSSFVSPQLSVLLLFIYFFHFDASPKTDHLRDNFKQICCLYLLELL